MMTNPVPAMTIAGRPIGPGQRPYVIAEMSANHDGSLDKALRIVEEASKSGADAVKLQTYTEDTMTLDSTADDFMIHGGLWDGESLYSLYRKAKLPWEWHRPIFDRARSLGLTVFSTPFDATAVDFLEELGAPAYKIASFEIIDLPLIRYVASKRKPMIMSTGMANPEEIAEALEAARSGGCKDLVLLHCVSGYPTPVQDCNLRTIQDMAQRFGVAVGLSDHTMGSVVSVAAVAQGAVLVEKHFTLDRGAGGPDDSFSIEPAELKALRDGVDAAWQALGTVSYKPEESEKANMKFRRSLYFVEELPAGAAVTGKSVRSIRPGYGLPPKHLSQVVGKVLREPVKAGTPVSWKVFQDAS